MSFANLPHARGMASRPGLWTQPRSTPMEMETLQDLYVEERYVAQSQSCRARRPGGALQANRHCDDGERRCHPGTASVLLLLPAVSRRRAVRRDDRERRRERQLPAITASAPAAETPAGELPEDVSSVRRRPRAFRLSMRTCGSRHRANQTARATAIRAPESGCRNTRWAWRSGRRTDLRAAVLCRALPAKTALTSAEFDFENPYVVIQVFDSSSMNSDERMSSAIVRKRAALDAATGVRENRMTA